MKSDLLDRFDMVMSRLKPVEPSEGFDFEFRRRLKEAMAFRYEETFFDRLARRANETAEGLKHVLVPERPVLIGAFATLILMVSFGLYLYSVQPSNPILTSIQGIIMVQDPKDIGWKKIDLAYNFKTNDVITTGEGSRIDIELSDKYAVRIKDRTRFRIARLTPRFGKGEALFELSEGKMLVDISEGFEGSKFVVDTKAGVAKALGTKFLVDGDRQKMKISVLEGEVEVKGHYTPEKFLLAEKSVIVGPGQKTEVTVGGHPLTPQRLIEKEWQELEELYQIGKKPQIILLIKNTPDRAKQLLRPCPLYISDEKPKELPVLLEEALSKIEEAITKQDKTRHLESIRILERLVEEEPHKGYNIQLLLYIGAYYEYISEHISAIAVFEKVITKYPDSTFASIAQCAIGIIYEEKLNNMKKAEEAYEQVLKRYPNSLEAIWIEAKLGIKKLAKTIE